MDVIRRPGNHRQERLTYFRPGPGLVKPQAGCTNGMEPQEGSQGQNGCERQQAYPAARKSREAGRPRSGWLRDIHRLSYARQAGRRGISQQPLLL